MSELCGNITKDITIDCDNPLVGAVEDVLALINSDDIDSVTRDAMNPSIITGITLKAGKRAVKLVGKNYSTDKKIELRKRAYSEGWEHEIIFRAMNYDDDIKDTINEMPKGNFVAVVQNVFKGDDKKVAYEVLGVDIGLDLVEAVSNSAEEDTQGGYVLTLRTDERFQEPKIPATFFATDAATTKTAFEALIAAVSA